MIQISPSAAKEIKRLQSKQQDKETRFRLQVQAGGCSGLYYQMTFDRVVKPDDLLCNCNGILVVINAHSLSYISNLTLDYSEDLMGGGFRFHNSQAIASCGCGNSFATSPDSTVVSADCRTF